MKDNNYTSQQMHELLDANKDGSVDAKEFVDGLLTLRIPGMQQKDFVIIFEAIDADDNKYLSIDEFALYLEGATKERDQRLRDIPPEIN